MSATMKQREMTRVASRHYVTRTGVPSEGVTIAPGMEIHWAGGTEAAAEPELASVSDVIHAAGDRLEFLLATGGDDARIAIGINKLREALFWIEQPPFAVAFYKEADRDRPASMTLAVRSPAGTYDLGRD